MKILLTAFKVYYVLEGPPVGVKTEEEQRKREQEKTLCRGYILSTLTDRLYDLYTPMTSAREIWNSLEEKYTAEKEGADKFITFKFFEFAMEDNVKKLMRTSEDFTLGQIQKHLRIEEETRICEKNLNGASSSKVNYVDSGKNNKGNDKKRKGTWNSSNDNKKDKKSLSDVVCNKCGEKRHIKRYCKNPKKKNQNSNKKDEYANAVEQVDTTEITTMVSEMNIGKIQGLHMASVTTTDDWWYDSGATTHVCNNKDLFKTYNETKDGHKVIIGDNHTLKVIGSGIMEIQFTSGKKLTLMNALYVPNIMKNLVSGFKLCKSEIKAVIELDKNGVVEWKNRVLQDMINVMLVSANLPKNLWGEALLTACHVSNRVIAKKLKVSPYEIRKDSNIIVESRDVDFFENKFLHDSISTNEIVTQILQDNYGLNLNSNNKRNTTESSSASRRSEKARKERILDPDFINSQAIIYLVKGFVLSGLENKVFKLKKSLYGLKLAPKQWNDKFDKSILSNGFTNNSSDRCIYSKFTKDYGVILCLYVDDILIVGTNMEGINETNKFLSSSFQMKDMNEVSTILRIKVKRHSRGYALNQCHYIDKIIDKFQHLNIEEANTPYEQSCKLVKNDGIVVAQIEYASAICCLMYATHCTRPDIAYVVCKLSRYTSNLSHDHWKAIGRVFGYLKRTRKLALYYDRLSVVLEGYSDASWIMAVVILNPQLVGFLQLVVRLFVGVQRNKHALHIPQ
nr:zinc finger, CCHC-type [Tanacetum cinerariifolium]